MLGDSTFTDEMLLRRQVLLESFISLPDNKLAPFIDLRFSLSLSNTFTRYYSLYETYNHRQFGLSVGSAITNITVQELTGIHPKLTGLNLSYCNQVTDVGLWAIARHCLHLEKLFLKACDKVRSCFYCFSMLQCLLFKISNVGIRSLSLGCSSLLVLELSDCPLVDDVTLTVIAAGSWQNLSEIYVRNCTKITDNGLAKLAQGQVRNTLSSKNLTL